jgi:hypothetical protein
LCHIHARHACRASQWLAWAIALRVKRLNFFPQRCLRRRGIDLCKEAVTPRALLLRSVLKVGKILLHKRIVNDKEGVIVSAPADRRNYLD